MNEKKILLVDDDANILGLYSAIFQENGLNFTVAKNGQEALDKAKSEKPHLILLDIMLPDLNGFKVLEELKDDSETKNIQVWMLSVLAEESNKKRAEGLGADGYLVKSSYTPQQISDKVKELLGK